jgi:uroporphyrinogen decarboxylase
MREDERMTEPASRSDGTPEVPALLAVLAGKAVHPPPVWLMRQAGRYLPEYRVLREWAGSFLEFCYTPGMAIEATLQPVRRFGVDAAILFSDILVVADALGAEVSFVEGMGPVVAPIRDQEAVAKLSLDRIAEHCVPVYTAIEGVRAELPGSAALIGFAGGPWTVATYMVEGGSSRDFAEIKRWMWQDPAGFGRLIELLTEATARHLVGQVEAGAQCVQLFESWAGVLPEPEFERWVVAPTRRIVGAVRARFPEVPVIGFARGAGALIERYAVGTGVQGVGLDAMVPMAQAQAVQRRFAVQGNLDPVLLLTGGAAMTARARVIVESLDRGPHVFNLGHGVLPTTPPDHVAALLDAVRGG